VKDLEGLYTGKTMIEGLSSRVIDAIYQNGWCDPKEIGVEHPIANHYYILKNTKNSALGFFNHTTNRIERIDKRPAYRIMPGMPNRYLPFMPL